MANRRFRLIALLLAALLPLAGCAGRRSGGSGFAMGSVLSVELYAGDAAAAPVRREIFSAVSALDAAISATRPESEISALNRGEPAACSEDTLLLLREALALCEESGSALDVTLGAVTELWGFATDSPHLPAPDGLAAALRTVGTDNAVFTEDGVTLLNGARLDLGAVGKGAGTDEALRVLRAAGRAAIVNFGGTVLLYGRPAGKRSWTVGIRDPFAAAETECFARAELAPAGPDDAFFLSTSGGYEKRFTENGVEYHHILDPKTGYPAHAGLAGVTVISGGGLLSDALSTACFVMGLCGEALELLQAHGAEAVFVLEDRGVYVTPGLRDRVTVTAEGFHTVDYGT